MEARKISPENLLNINIPIELVISISSYLTPLELTILSFVNRSFYELVHHHMNWEKELAKSFPLFKPSPDTLNKSKFIQYLEARQYMDLSARELNLFTLARKGNVAELLNLLQYEDLNIKDLDGYYLTDWFWIKKFPNANQACAEILEKLVQPKMVNRDFTPENIALVKRACILRQADKLEGFKLNIDNHHFLIEEIYNNCENFIEAVNVLLSSLNDNYSPNSLESFILGLIFFLILHSSQLQNNNLALCKQFWTSLPANTRRLVFLPMAKEAIHEEFTEALSFIKKHDPEIFSKHASDLFFEAWFNNKYKSTLFLYSSEIIVELDDIIYTTINNSTPKMLETLIRAGIEFDQAYIKDTYNVFTKKLHHKTPFQYAVLKDRIPQAEILLKFGANPNKISKHGFFDHSKSEYLAVLEKRNPQFIKEVALARYKAVEKENESKQKNNNLTTSQANLFAATKAARKYLKGKITKEELLAHEKHLKKGELKEITKETKLFKRQW